IDTASRTGERTTTPSLYRRGASCALEARGTASSPCSSPPVLSLDRTSPLPNPGNLPSFFRLGFRLHILLQPFLDKSHRVSVRLRRLARAVGHPVERSHAQAASSSTHAGNASMARRLFPSPSISPSVHAQAEPDAARLAEAPETPLGCPPRRSSPIHQQQNNPCYRQKVPVSHLHV